MADQAHASTSVRVPVNPKPLRVLVRADASAAKGGGHAMRCLALANRISASGGTAHFVWRETTAEIRRRVELAGHGWSAIEATPPPAAGREDWDSVIDDARTQQSDADSTLAIAGRIAADWIVADHYALDRTWEAIVRRRAKVLVIDDLANRPHDCDLLLDQTYGRAAGDYRGLVPGDCTVLAGCEYALLRPEFAAARELSLSRRQEDRAVERILVSLGMADPNGLSSIVLDRLMELGQRPMIDLVIGRASPAFASLAEASERTDNLAIHADVDGMAPLMARADLAIGAAGTTSWERCCLGVPSLTLVLAHNQQLIAAQLEEAGAHHVAAHPATPAFVQSLSRMLDDGTARAAMSRRAAVLVDGLGCQRVSAAMQALPTRNCS